MELSLREYFFIDDILCESVKMGCQPSCFTRTGRNGGRVPRREEGSPLTLIWEAISAQRHPQTILLIAGNVFKCFLFKTVSMRYLRLPRWFTYEAKHVSAAASTDTYATSSDYRSSVELDKNRSYGLLRLKSRATKGNRGSSIRKFGKSEVGTYLKMLLKQNEQKTTASRGRFANNTDEKASDGE